MINFAACAVVLLAPLFDNFEVVFKQDNRSFIQSRYISSRVFELSEKFTSDESGKLHITGYTIGVGFIHSNFYTSPQLSELNHRLNLIDKFATKKINLDLIKFRKFRWALEFPILPSLRYQAYWSAYSRSLSIAIDCGLARLKLEI